MKLGTVKSAEWSDAVCALMWVDGWDSWRLRRWLPAYMKVKMAVEGDRIVDTVRHVEHKLTPGCVVVVKKNGSVEII